MKKIFIMFLAVVFGLCLVSCDNKTNDEKEQSISETETDAAYDTGINLSDNLDDFTFKIDDVVYKLPMETEAFTKTGWSFPEYFDEYDKAIDSEHKESEYLVKGNNKLI